MLKPILTIATAFILATADPSASVAVDPEAFETQVRPILQKHCLRCHGVEVQKAGLSLTSADTIFAGGESGPIIDVSDAEQSTMLKMITEREMPPEGEPPLSLGEIDIIRRWIMAPRTVQKALTQHDVLPILYLRCVSCHGRQKQEGGFDIRTRASLLAGGKSGPAIRLGEPDESLLVQKITAGEMPPKKQLAAVSVKPVEEGELRKIREWIASGAPESDRKPDVADGSPDPLVSDTDREFWSFQSPLARPLPAAPLHRSQNPIDQFVQAKLAENGLQISWPADRAVLLRRLAFDLTGLPPTEEQTTRFVDDDADLPDAVERFVDELLASPAYGERWGQFWLDLAGYSDSEGVQDSDLVRPSAYRYRDYVIRAWNADKPYSRFVLEQLAGDELADYESASEITTEIYDNLVATGFLRMSPDGTFAGITGFVPNRLDVIDDQLRSVSAAFLGLTIGCSRCHSHKFDPLPQRDYYRLAAIFKGAIDEHDWLKPTRQPGEPGTQDRYLPHVTSSERRDWELSEQAIEAELAPLKQQLGQLKDEPEKKKSLETQIQSIEARRQTQPLIHALWDRGEPSPTYILARGDYLRPTQLVGPGFPAVLTNGRDALRADAPWPGAHKTGLRRSFAQWLVSPDHPLTARVAVNRIWKHHFGQGIVSTLDNFGRAGDRPSHPELLDWLSREIIRREWSGKWLQRLIVTSATYGQTSRTDERVMHADPENRLLSRMPVRRLEAEALRDSLYSIADRLDRRPFGPGDAVEAHPDGLITSTRVHGSSRRSIYILHRRSQPLTLLADFDRPAMSPNCIARVESTVAPQALHLLNSGDVHELSLALAESIDRECAGNRIAQIRRIHQRAYSRDPDDQEMAIAMTGIQRMEEEWARVLSSDGKAQDAARRALANYCHAVLNSAALLFVE